MTIRMCWLGGARRGFYYVSIKQKAGVVVRTVRQVLWYERYGKPHCDTLMLLKFNFVLLMHLVFVFYTPELWSLSRNMWVLIMFLKEILVYLCAFFGTIIVCICW